MLKINCFHSSLLPCQIIPSSTTSISSDHLLKGYTNDGFSLTYYASTGADPEFGKGGVHFVEKVEDQKKKKKQNE